MRPFASVVGVLLCPVAGATIVAEYPGLKLRALLSGNIAHGNDPLLLRLRAFRDDGIGKAILSGASHRTVRILVDENSAELEALANKRSLNIEIRIAEGARSGRFRGSAIAHSFCMRAGKESFGTVYADLDWTPNGLRGKAVEVLESGGPVWEDSPNVAAAFDWEFDRALPIEWASMHGSIAQPMPPPLCLQDSREWLKRRIDGLAKKIRSARK
jgi:hypothetical protein